MEWRKSLTRGHRWYFLLSGCGFLALAWLAACLWLFRVIAFDGLVNSAMLYLSIAVMNFLMLPVGARVDRFTALPTGARKETWVEGTAIGPGSTIAGIILSKDRVRVGVDGEGLRIRRILGTGMVVVGLILLWGGLSLLMQALAQGEVRPTDNIPLGMLILGLPALAATGYFVAFDPPRSRHDVLHPWSAVARIVETKDALYIHWADGSAPLIVEIPRYALRRILPQIAEHAAVDEYVRPVKRPSQSAASGEPVAIDGRTTERLDKALDSLRRLDP
jgi:hypothetical protein